MDKILGIVRHVLTFGGGFAIGKGWMDQETLEIIVAGVVALVGAVWSVTSKKHTDEV